DSIIESYNANVKVIERKTRVFTWAFWITAGATGLMGVAIMLHVVVQTEGLLAPMPTPTPMPMAPPTVPPTTPWRPRLEKSMSTTKGPRSRADSELSNLVLEGGKSRPYKIVRDAGSGRFVRRESVQRRSPATVTIKPSSKPSSR